jgi:hypothetical protein
MTASAKSVSYAEAPSGGETNDQSHGVTSDMARAMDSLPSGLLVAILGLLAMAVVSVTWRSRRRARGAARLLAQAAETLPPGPAGPYNPALTPEGNALLRWLWSHRPPAAAAPEPDEASVVVLRGQVPGKVCPSCGVYIPAAARECVHCGEFLDD